MATRKTKRTKRPAARPQRIARALAHATFFGTAAASKRFDVKAATLASWWKRVDADEDLARRYARQVARLDTGWLVEADEALVAIIRKLREIVDSLEVGPQSIGDLTDLLNAARTLGELRIAHAAVVFDEDAGQDREVAADAPRGASGSTVH